MPHARIPFGKSRVPADTRNWALATASELHCPAEEAIWRLFADYTNKNTNKTDGCRELLCVFSMPREKFPENQKSN